MEALPLPCPLLSAGSPELANPQAMRSSPSSHPGTQGRIQGRWVPRRHLMHTSQNTRPVAGKSNVSPPIVVPKANHTLRSNFSKEDRCRVYKWLGGAQHLRTRRGPSGSKENCIENFKAMCRDHRSNSRNTVGVSDALATCDIGNDFHSKGNGRGVLEGCRSNRDRS